jgi:hypothetical protein
VRLRGPIAVGIEWMVGRSVPPGGTECGAVISVGKDGSPMDALQSEAGCD